MGAADRDSAKGCAEGSEVRKRLQVGPTYCELSAISGMKSAGKLDKSGSFVNG